MAQDVHYGTKEDLLVGISLAASCRNNSSSHTSDSWNNNNNNLLLGSFHHKRGFQKGPIKTKFWQTGSEIAPG